MASADQPARCVAGDITKYIVLVLEHYRNSLAPGIARRSDLRWFEIEDHHEIEGRRAMLLAEQPDHSQARPQPVHSSYWQRGNVRDWNLGIKSLRFRETRVKLQLVLDDLTVRKDLHLMTVGSKQSSDQLDLRPVRHASVPHDRPSLNQRRPLIRRDVCDPHVTRPPCYPACAR